MKTVKRLFAVLLTSLCMFAFSTSSFADIPPLSGTLTDKSTGEKITGAVVTIENSYIYALSDAQGNFFLDNLKGKSITLHVNHIAYQPFTQTITLPSDELKLQLTTKDILSDEVTVTATRANASSGMAYTSISKEELDRNNLGQDLPYLLDRTPSVVVTSDAGTGIGYTGIRIRGSDATRVNVTINGVPVNDAEAHAVYWVDLPDFASSVDNIQIQRGVGTSTNGAGAFGGSVNIQSSALAMEPHAELSSSFGSFNSWKNTVQFGTGLIEKKYSFEGRLSKITSDGYIDRGSSDLKSFYLSGGYYNNNSSLRMIMFSGKEKTYQAWYGVPEDSLKTNRTFNPAGMYTDADGNTKYYDNQTDNYQQDYYQLLYSKTINRFWNLNAALHYTKGKGYYEEYQPGEALSKYGIQDIVLNSDTISSSDIIRQRWLDNDFYGFTYSLNYEKDNMQFTFGGAGNRFTGQHYGTVVWAQYAGNSTINQKYYNDDATKNDFNVFGRMTYAVNTGLHLFADMQYRTIEYSFLGINDEGAPLRHVVDLNFFNPKAGITFEPKKNHKLYASLAVGHKEPIRDDYLSYSPALPKPEEMTDLEAGYNYSGNKVKAGFNFYFMNYTNQLILTGALNADGAYLRQNVDKSSRTGIELEATWSILKNLSLYANTTLSSNKIEQFEAVFYDEFYAPQSSVLNNSDISFSPSVISAGALRWSPLKNLFAEFSTKYVGKQYLDNTSDETRKLNAYSVSNLLFNYSIPLAGMKGLELKLAVNNLFDALYESNGATYPSYYEGVLYNYNYYYPQAGRSILGGVALKF